MTSPRTCSRSLSIVSVIIRLNPPVTRAAAHPACLFRCRPQSRPSLPSWAGRSTDRREAILPRLFLQLDYLYTPSSDVAAAARFFTHVLGGKLAFAGEGVGARGAMVELTDGS